jgi:hypothetical protein
MRCQNLMCNALFAFNYSVTLIGIMCPTVSNKTVAMFCNLGVIGV